MRLTRNGITSANAVNAAENQTSAITITATDNDATLAFYKTGGDDSGKLANNTATGVITFNNDPDYENPDDDNNDRDYEFNVQVRDRAGNNSVTQAVTITVTDVDEAPTGIALSNDNIDENSGANQIIGFLTATDPDATGNDHLDWYYLSGHGFACAVQGANDGDFSINSTN